jgi:hypothetical protein
MRLLKYEMNCNVYELQFIFLDNMNGYNWWKTCQKSELSAKGRCNYTFLAFAAISWRVCRCHDTQHKGFT